MFLKKIIAQKRVINKSENRTIRNFSTILENNEWYVYHKHIKYKIHISIQSLVRVYHSYKRPTDSNEEWVPKFGIKYFPNLHKTLKEFSPIKPDMIVRGHIVNNEFIIDWNYIARKNERAYRKYKKQLKNAESTKRL